MSCIVALKHGDTLYMGADSAGVSAMDITVRADEKVFRRGNMLFGFTTSFRMGQILRYAVDIPDQPADQDDYHYLCTSFIDSAMACLADKGFARSKDGEKSGGVFLLGYRNNIYKIESDFQIGRGAACYEAVGCGAKYAKGALHCLTSFKAGKSPADPESIVRQALAAAVTHSAGVCEPFLVERLSSHTEKSACRPDLQVAPN